MGMARWVVITAAVAALVVARLPAAIGQDDGELRRSFGAFLRTQDMVIDSVPDLYPGGYARISLHARNANLGGMVVDDVWVRLIGVSLDPAALQKGQLRVVDYRGTAIHGQVGVRRLQDFFTAAIKDLRVWSDGVSLYVEGSLPYEGVSLRVWLKGQFSVDGTKDVHFHIENMTVDGFPVFSPIIRVLEDKINPVLSQRDWPVTFTLKSLQMTKEGFVLSSQPDALAPCTFCLQSDESVSRP
ncbi:MAG TPA: hypothetical protein VNA31_06215 [bacterium]|nr:hypothetical protein [bacterium]